MDPKSTVDILEHVTEGGVQVMLYAPAGGRQPGTGSARLTYCQKTGIIGRDDVTAEKPAGEERAAETARARVR